MMNKSDTWVKFQRNLGLGGSLPLKYTLSGSLKEFNLGMGHAQELEGLGGPLPLGMIVLSQLLQKLNTVLWF